MRDTNKRNIKKNKMCLITVIICLLLMNFSCKFSPAPTQDQKNEVAQAVDLGLPSGTLWCDRNVGATFLEDYGHYFAWGETSQKKNYSWQSYKWCNGTYRTQTKYGIIDCKYTLDFKDDAAYINMGEKWRTPTYSELEELKRLCSWKWTTQNKIKGYRVTGPNGNSIFLPASGCCKSNTLYGTNSYGFYLSSSLYDNRFDYMWYLSFSKDDYYVASSARYYGRTVRAVVR